MSRCPMSFQRRPEMFMNSFDEAYASYLSALQKLHETDEISEKNMLFRQLSMQLSDLEKRLDELKRPRSSAVGPDR